MDRFVVKWVVWTALLYLGAGCGKAGSGSGGGSQPPEPDPEPLNLTTGVPLDALPYQLPFLTSCNRRENASIPTLDESATLDGKIDEWSDLEPLFFGGAGEHRKVDLRRSYFALHLGQVNLAVEGGKDIENFNIEFGGLVVRNGSLVRSVNQKLTIRGDQVFEGDELLGESMAKVVHGRDWSEVWLSRKLLGPALSWPMWWIRLSADYQDHFDSLPAYFGKSVHNPDVTSFHSEHCRTWSMQPAEVEMQYVLDSDESIGDESSLTKTNAAWASQLVRLAFNAVTELLGEPPIRSGSVPVVITTKNVERNFVEEFTGNSAETAARLDRGLLLNISHFEDIQVFPQGQVLVDSMRYFVERYLVRGQHAFETVIVREAFVGMAMKKILGKSYFVDRFTDPFASFLKDPDAQSLDEKYDQLREGQFSSESNRQLFAQLAGEKARAFGRLLMHYVPIEDLMAAWSSSSNLAEFKETLVSHSDFDQLAHVFPGWTEQGQFTGFGHPDLLRDRDGEGLADIVELQFGTRADKSDTDRDGWSDLAEFVLGTKPNSFRLYPQKLVADGNFGDWFKLMPRKVHLNEEASGNCAGKVTHYSAIGSRHELMFAVKADGFDRSKPYFWEAHLQIVPEEKQFVVSTRSRDFQVDVRDEKTDKLVLRMGRAFAVGDSAFEYGLRRSDLGLTTHFNQPDKLKLKFRLQKMDGDERVVCDETEWFSPWVYRPEGQL